MLKLGREVEELEVQTLVSEITQQVQELATKPGDLSSAPMHTHTYTHTHTHTHTTIDTNKYCYCYHY